MSSYLQNYKLQNFIYPALLALGPGLERFTHLQVLFASLFFGDLIFLGEIFYEGNFFLWHKIFVDLKFSGDFKGRLEANLGDLLSLLFLVLYPSFSLELSELVTILISPSSHIDTQDWTGDRMCLGLSRHRCLITPDQSITDHSPLK